MMKSKTNKSKRIMSQMLLICLFVTAMSQNALAGEILSAISRDYDFATKEGTSLSMLGPVYLNKYGFAIGENVCSGWDDIYGSLYTYTDYNTTLTGTFKNATLKIYYNYNQKVLSYDILYGTGILKNEKGDLIAKGSFSAKENLIAIPALAKSVFKYKPSNKKLKHKWSNKKPSVFASLSYNDKSDEWTINDDKFSFLMEMYELSRTALYTRLPESIVRSSIVKLPKGSFILFGYKVVVPKDGAILKFEQGKVIESSGCEVIEIDDKK